jgi:hypothetical protein
VDSIYIVSTSFVCYSNPQGPACQCWSLFLLFFMYIVVVLFNSTGMCLFSARLACVLPLQVLRLSLLLPPQAQCLQAAKSILNKYNKILARMKLTTLTCCVLFSLLLMKSMFWGRDRYCVALLEIQYLTIFDRSRDKLWRELLNLHRKQKENHLSQDAEVLLI